MIFILHRERSQKLDYIPRFGNLMENYNATHMDLFVSKFHVFPIELRIALLLLNAYCFGFSSFEFFNNFQRN